MFKVIRRFFNRLIRGLWSFLREVISGAEEIVLAELKDFALDIAKELEGKNITGKQKQQIAREYIAKEAIRRGLTIRDSLINLLIELAVARLRKVG